ncbi:hypothetical protein V2H29_14985 [Lysinibacillus fusiformis]|uniref:hypothetical protein n=1 Tax=Lysinibacillus fusiformis TaxID=28031 RepID=UPI002EBF2EFF|nr:hypothetical protein [Lysinibacillus fusiformis]
MPIGPGILFGTSKVQLLAVEEVNNRWMLTEQCTAPFLRQVDTNLVHYPHIEANEKNIALFVRAATDAMDQLSTKIIDLKSPALQSIVVRFDGIIGNKIGVFLIELYTDVIQEYSDSVKLMKAIDVYEKLSLNHLLDFYTNKTNSPFKNFNLDEFRHLYLPRNVKADEVNN